MRALDLACECSTSVVGSLLAAELVGSSGCVVGIDRNSQVIALARERSQIAGLANLEFKAVELEGFSDPAPFDCVIGRYVLIHQSDPAEFLRTAARFVRAGGLVAFHEINLTSSFKSFPRIRLWDAAGELVMAAFQQGLPHYDAGNRLKELFVDAGLPSPSLFCETPTSGGENSCFYAWLAETMRSVLPQLARLGVVMDGERSIGTLESALRNTAVELQSHVEVPEQVYAWVELSNAVSQASNNRASCCEALWQMTTAGSTFCGSHLRG